MSSIAIRVLKNYGVSKPSDPLIREMDDYISRVGTILNEAEIFKIIGKVARYKIKHSRR